MANHKRHRPASRRGFAGKTYKAWKQNGAEKAARQRPNVTRKMQEDE